jgi:shikimate kinase
MTSSIVLVGPMGSGKSTVGRALAEMLGRPFIDTDEVVARDSGESISQLMATRGEGAFRDLEVAAVKEATSTPGSVIACGGGAVLRPSNVEALRDAGTVVYLRVSPAVAAARLGEGTGRPLLEGGPVEETLSALITEREPAYRAVADYTADADEPVEDVVEAIMGITGE